MLQINTFTSAGLRVAAMSGHAEGDGALATASAPNRRAFLAALTLDPRRLVCPKQVHGTDVVIARETDAGKGAFGPENAITVADAIITDVSGLPIGITVADCVPVALYDPAGPAVGLAHAGRDGTRNRITAATVAAMQSNFGSIPSDLLAFIGPSAGPCCYEVSSELAADFAAAGHPTWGRHLDLWEANRQQLLAVGIPASQITLAETCTICTTDYFSYRREKTTARNLMVLAL